MTGHLVFTVKDNSTRNPISGAHVAADGKSGSTNSNGVCDISVTVYKTYSYTVSKSGYDNKTGSLSVKDGETSNKNVYLSPKDSPTPAPPSPRPTPTPRPPAPPPAPSSEFWQIVSIPGDAELRILGNYVGRTPQSGHMLPGSYDYDLRKLGYLSSVGTMKITAGTSFYRSVELTPEQAPAPPPAPPSPLPRPDLDSAIMALMLGATAEEKERVKGLSQSDKEFYLAELRSPTLGDAAYMNKLMNIQRHLYMSGWDQFLNSVNEGWSNLVYEAEKLVPFSLVDNIIQTDPKAWDDFSLRRSQELGISIYDYQNTWHDDAMWGAIGDAIFTGAFSLASKLLGPVLSGVFSKLKGYIMNLLPSRLFNNAIMTNTRGSLHLDLGNFFTELRNKLALLGSTLKNSFTGAIDDIAKKLKGDVGALTTWTKWAPGPEGEKVVIDVIEKTGQKAATSWLRSNIRSGAKWLVIGHIFEFAMWSYAFRLAGIVPPAMGTRYNNLVIGEMPEALNALESVKFTCDVAEWNYALQLVDDVNTGFDDFIRTAEQNPLSADSLTKLGQAYQSLFLGHPGFTNPEVLEMYKSKREFWVSARDAAIAAAKAKCPNLAGQVPIPPASQGETAHITASPIPINVALDSGAAETRWGSPFDVLVKPGVHKLTFSKEPEYEPQTRTFTVTAGASPYISPVELVLKTVPPAQTTAQVTIFTSPGEVSFEIPGIIAGTTNASGTYTGTFPIGYHSIGYSKEGYDSKTGYLTVTAEGPNKTTMVLQLSFVPYVPPPKEPTPEETGSIDIYTMPTNVDVEIPGFPAGNTGDYGNVSIDVPAGTYEVRLSTPGYLSETQNVFLKAGQHHVMRVFLSEGIEPSPEPGPGQEPTPTAWRYDITSTPSGAKIIVNDEFQDKWTPDYVILEPSAYYILRVEKSGYYPAEMEIYTDPID